GTGFPEGTRAERDAGLWSETQSWSWNLANNSAALMATIEKGKHASKLEVRYRPASKDYTLTRTNLDKSTDEFIGTLIEGKQKESILTVERGELPAARERYILTILHANRFLLRREEQAAGQKSWVKKDQLGCTKAGEPFANNSSERECIVTGGKGTSTVVHQGKTYYVCCSGCKDAFEADPEKFVKALEEKRRKK
ncbi:MAG: YHS domain-containing protein, partial [Gemmataceae bacterium]